MLWVGVTHITQGRAIAPKRPEDILEINRRNRRTLQIMIPRTLLSSRWNRDTERDHRSYMRKRKLYQLLAILDSRSLDSLREFLSTSFFNTNPTLTVFFDAWRSHVLGPDYDPDLTTEALLAGTGIQPARMDKLSTQLNQKVIEFLALVEFRDSDHLQKELFMQALLRREMPISDLKWQYGRIANRVKKEPESSERILHRLHLRRTLAEATVHDRKTRVVWQEDFTELHDLLDEYYQLEKLKLTCASLNAWHIFNHGKEAMDASPWPVQMDPAIRSELPPLPRAYALIISLLEAEDPTSDPLAELLELLDAHAADFSDLEANQVYAYVLNFCIRQMNQGRHEFGHSTATLYRQLLTNGLILNQGTLPPQQFKNIVALHCRIGELDWVRGFLDQAHDLLPPEFAPQAILYNQAVLSFHLRDYTAAIQSLKNVIADLRDDVFYGIDARVYLWRSYFENLAAASLDEVDEMYRLYDSFRIYLDRNEKISLAHKTDYRNFIRLFKRMIDLYPDLFRDRGALEALQAEVRDTSPLPNRGWFLEKINSALQSLDKT